MKDYLLSAAKQYAPCYLYDKDALCTRAGTLSEVFPAFDVLFSVKANPFPPVVRTLAGCGIGADAASANEVLLAKSCGMAKEDIYFSAAGKSDESLAKIWGECHIIADSLGEVRRIGAMAQKRGEIRSIGVRINPAFGVGGAQPSASKFGINEEDLPMLKALCAALPITVEGIHVHLRSQNLDADILGTYYRDCWELAKRTAAQLGCKMEYVNFGGGLGIAYDLRYESPLELTRLRAYTDAIADENKKTLRARLMLESGRFLTGQMGYYFVRVVDKKTSRGKTYVIVENAMNGLQKPAIAAMLQHAVEKGALIPQEPMFTSVYAFPITAYGDESVTETVDIVGNLCCAQDILAEDFTGAKLEVGDLIAFGNAGAYACTLTAQRFSGHTPPKELLVCADGSCVAEYDPMP